MDVKELRLGNLVEYDGLPCKVKQIEESGLAVLFEDGEDTWIDVWQFCPISITEKWLLKFGFEKDEYQFTLNKFTIIPKNIKYSYSEGRVFYDNYKINIIIPDYIHHLQNLYYCLSGKELTYE